MNISLIFKFFIIFFITFLKTKINNCIDQWEFNKKFINFLNDTNNST